MFILSSITTYYHCTVQHCESSAVLYEHSITWYSSARNVMMAVEELGIAQTPTTIRAVARSWCSWWRPNGSLSLSLSDIPLPIWLGAFHRSELKILDQSITGDKNQILWISVLLNCPLHCNALTQMLFVVFPNIPPHPANFTDVGIWDKIQYCHHTAMQR